MTSSVLPALVFFAGAGLVAVLPGRLRPVISLLVPVAGALNLLLYVESGAFWQVGVFDYSLTCQKVLVVAAKEMRKVLMRKKDYYDDE